VCREKVDACWKGRPGVTRRQKAEEKPLQVRKRGRYRSGAYLRIASFWRGKTREILRLVRFSPHKVFTQVVQYVTRLR
jgi:hypothetical protein